MIRYIVKNNSNQIINKNIYLTENKHNVLNDILVNEHTQ